MDVRGWAAGAEIVHAALRAHLAERGSGEKVSAPSGRGGALDHAGEACEGNLPPVNGDPPTESIRRALLKASVIRACVRYRTKACNACCGLMKRRMQIALERAHECERAAANITDRKFRDQWLDLARQWRELAESMRRADHDGE
jgi:hypothetical protein